MVGGTYSRRLGLGSDFEFRARLDRFTRLASSVSSGKGALRSISGKLMGGEMVCRFSKR